MLVLSFESLLFSIGHKAVRAEVVYLRLVTGSSELLSVYSVTFGRILVGKTLGTGELIQTVVGLGSHYVVLDFDYLTVSGTDKRRGVVTIAEFLALLAGFLFYIFLAVEALGIHGYERSHAVTTVNVESLSNGAKAVGSVNVTTVFHVVLHTPAEFTGVRTIGVLPVVIPEVVEVVDVSTLCADYFTEHTVLCHVEGIHFEPVVAAVFKNHTVLAVLFRKVDEVPALLQVHSRRYFDSSVLAIFKGALSHGYVVIPVGSYINKVNVAALAEFFITLFA